MKAKMKSIDSNSLSTRTIIADINLEFDHQKVFEQLPVNYRLKDYDCEIVAMYHKDIIKGDSSYFSKKKKISSFRNAVNIIVKSEYSCCNIKLSDRGKFQISGAKNLERTYESIQYLISLILKLKCHVYQKEKDDIKISFTTVMTNFVYNVGFKIDKDKLNRLMKKDPSHQFYNLFETSFGYTGLNLKLKMNPSLYDLKIPVFRLLNDKWIREEKQYINMGKNQKFNSFLVFHSGKIICSGMTEETMNDSFQTFSKYINQNKNKIIECIETNV